MSNWLGESFSSLTGQISSFTKEVLSESPEEFLDPMAQLDIARQRIKELELQAKIHKQEKQNEEKFESVVETRRLERIQKLCTDLEERSETADLQVQTQSERYRNALQEKEKELLILKREHFELKGKIESSSKKNRHFEETVGKGDLWTDESYVDLDDEISCRTEEEVEVVDTPLQNSYKYAEDRGDASELCTLQTRLQEVESRLQQEIEQHQQELSSLQDLHEHQVEQLKSRYENQLRRNFVPDTTTTTTIEPTGEEEENDDGGDETKKKMRLKLHQLTIECNRLTDAMATLEAEKQDQDRTVQLLGRQVEKLQKEKKSQVTSEKQESIEGENLLQSSQDHLQVTEKKDVSSQIQLESEVSRLQEQIAALSTTCEELEREKGALSEELVRMKDAEEENESNRTDDNKELETLQRRLQSLEEEVATLGAERDSLAAGLEELDAQHEEVVQKLLGSRDDHQRTSKELEEKLQQESQVQERLRMAFEEMESKKKSGEKETESFVERLFDILDRNKFDDQTSLSIKYKIVEDAVHELISQKEILQIELNKPQELKLQLDAKTIELADELKKVKDLEDKIKMAENGCLQLKNTGDHVVTSAVQTEEVISEANYDELNIKKINELEEFLVDRERQISGLNDILRVYKENLDPDQEAERRKYAKEITVLENRLKNLDSERDRMMSILDDKAKENSNLKMEVHQLMNVVSAERAALQKAQMNLEIAMQQRASNQTDSDNMTKEALQNLAHLVRDREMEIEALKQKNETLTSLLHEADKGASPSDTMSSTITALMSEKDQLSKIVENQQLERQHIVNALNQKHEENLSYHAEIQRLTHILSEAISCRDALNEQNAVIGRQYEEKQRSFLDAQTETIELKGRLHELEEHHAALKIKYDRLLREEQGGETSNGTEPVTANVRVDREEWESTSRDLETLTRNVHDKDKLLFEKDRQVHEKMRHIESIKELLQRKEEEVAMVKQHVEHIGGQLDSGRREAESLRERNTSLRSQMEEVRSEMTMVKDANSTLSVTLQEREFELKALREKVDTLSRMVETQQRPEEANEDIKRLLSESEQMRQRAQGFQAERDQALLALSHQQRNNEDLREQIKGPKEREERLLRELERLRSHLIHVEENYTQEALRAEDREKDLRNRLAQAEDRIQMASSTQTAASHHAVLQVESLQEQLRAVVEQRDEVLVSLSTTEDQLAQKSAALHTLQVVLEQLQQERQRDLAALQARHESQMLAERERTKKVALEMKAMQERLREATEALEAASRLSEQLDRKEETIRILRDEVEHRDVKIEKIKMEIHQITSRSEVTVDRTIVKNLVVGLLTVPSLQQKEVLRVIATILDFNKEERERTGLDHEINVRVSWISGWLGRKQPQTSSIQIQSHSIKSVTDQSLTEAFVRFLEKESQPRQPVARMLLDSSHDTNQRNSGTTTSNNKMTVARTNPFAYPIVANRGDSPTVGSSSLSSMGTSHLLLKPMSTALPIFAPSPVPSANNILRDVLQND